MFLQVLYFVKMFMFANQLAYDEGMVRNLHRMAQFLMLLYVCA